jgi:hypothetical protein
LETAATAVLALRDPAEAVALAGRAVAAEPLREAAHLLLVRAHAAAGDQAAALDAFATLRNTLAEELGLDPSPEAVDLHTRVLRGEPVGPGRRPPSGRARPAAADNLVFVGREAQLSAVSAALKRSPGPTVVIVGRSGDGKSRLLAEVAARSPRPVVAARAAPPEQDEPWSLARVLLAQVLAEDPTAASSLPDRSARALLRCRTGTERSARGCRISTGWRACSPTRGTCCGS